MGHNARFNKLRDDLAKEIDMLEKYPEDDEVFGVQMILNNFKQQLTFLDRQMQTAWKDFSSHHAELPNIQAAENFYTKALSDIQKLSANFISKNDSWRQKMPNSEMVSFCKEIMSKMNSISFYIDSLI